jgi:hypothetical protein
MREGGIALDTLRMRAPANFDKGIVQTAPLPYNDVPIAVMDDLGVPDGLVADLGDGAFP